jgi:2-dehydro-3-deoxygluconokinase
MTRVLTFGESMAALHGEGPLRLAGGMQLSIAGTESNVAIGLARLGHQAEWIGRLGDDELGRLVLRTLRAENVDVSHVIVDGSAPTGLLLFEHRIADITNVSYYRAGSAGSGICADDVARRLTDDVAALHVTGVTAALGNTAAEAIAGCVEIARRRGIPVSLDVNFRSRLWSAATARDTLRPLVSQVEILFGSEDEVMLVAADGSTDIDTAAQQIIADGTGTVVVKRGGAGATCCTLNVPARAASLRIQSSSGSRTPLSTRRSGELQPSALATLGFRPWPAACASPCALVRRHRHHQQEPARPDDRTARRPYSMAQASYDLARLRRNGLITRPHASTYDLTPAGLAFAIFYTKVHDPVVAAVRRRAAPCPASPARRPDRHPAPHRQPLRRSKAAYSTLTNSAQPSDSSPKGSLRS